jgi:hypothetical protein
MRCLGNMFHGKHRKVRQRTKTYLQSNLKTPRILQTERAKSDWRDTVGEGR